jgi:hypothetical protein
MDTGPAATGTTDSAETVDTTTTSDMAALVTTTSTTATEDTATTMDTDHHLELATAYRTTNTTVTGAEAATADTYHHQATAHTATVEPQRRQAATAVATTAVITGRELERTRCETIPTTAAT